jgi:hypothetical protein
MAMQITPRIAATLSPAEQQAMSDAVDMVEDFLLDELTERRHADGTTTSGAFSDRFLPDRHTDLYDFAMIRRLYVCLVVVAARLQDGWRPQACRAEELVTAAVVEQARFIFEESTGMNSDALGYLYELLFEDLDHQYMFDPAFDGIDDRDTYEGAQIGTGSLQPTAWFDPLRDDEPVHPLAREWSGSGQNNP